MRLRRLEAERAGYGGEKGEKVNDEWARAREEYGGWRMAVAVDYGYVL